MSFGASFPDVWGLSSLVCDIVSCTLSHGSDPGLDPGLKLASEEDDRRAANSCSTSPDFSPKPISSPSRSVALAIRSSSSFSRSFWWLLWWFPLEKCGSRFFTDRAQGHQASPCSFDESGPVCSDPLERVKKKKVLSGPSAGGLGNSVTEESLGSTVLFSLL
ncbi:hypothetical protein MUK42_16997 [Musa troglodytarum]|uniref:Uncharacterized protein n=1 Tax=Musa troglodytarum TaxID=320322 RepID=A0A9E7KWG5_9LILI|nr:hypothetical protein MUK42_16997 [Musa troglodytarum]URE31954.1 hypothetical protein MUK42_16997 [Musa troglodytarum]URE31956.1 hypothetical protein MUK42_16997 [Musa troglodytarum]